MTSKLTTLSGRRAHIWQRLSALYLLIYLPYLAWISLTLTATTDLASFTANLLSPIYLLPSLGAIALVLVHTWVGLRDILIDYTDRASTSFWLWTLRFVLFATLLNIIGLLTKLSLLN